MDRLMAGNPGPRSELVEKFTDEMIDLLKRRIADAHPSGDFAPKSAAEGRAAQRPRRKRG